jgi:signal transduction histidine kinase
MLGYLELLKAELPAGRQSEIVGRSLAEVSRIDRLVKDLLDYAAPAEDEAPTAAPSEILAEAAALLEHQGALAAVRLVKEFPPVLPTVAISRHKLLQVMINLLLNARDASAEGGTIRLGGTDGGKEVRLWVADEGDGIGEEALPHIFDPFYTGKPPGKGRGLGLFVCHRIVEEAGGRIEVRSRKDRGTTFSVQLNKVRDEAP